MIIDSEPRDVIRAAPGAETSINLRRRQRRFHDRVTSAEAPRRTVRRSVAAQPMEEKMHRRSLARLVATLGLAAAASLGTLGTAVAQPAPDRTGLAEAELAGPHDSAPTANLRRLANAIGLRNQGLCLEVTTPPGLGVGPVEISIGYGAGRLTRTYSNTNPAEYTVEFPPLTGAVRQEHVAITLTERVPGGPFHYTILSQVDVVPQYTVTASDLSFATGGCDPLNGEADPTFAWVDPSGGLHRVHTGGDAGSFDQFRGTWTGVDVNTGLTAPVITWVDRDPGGITIPRSYWLPRGEPLLPFAVSYPTTDTVVQEVTDTLTDIGGDCEAQVRYTLTYNPEGNLL
jgi:hypothetical protein